MTGDRSDWRALLPLIQAFVDGEAIEHKDFDNRWKPTERLRDLLMTHANYRIAPQDVQYGVWTVQFEETVHGAVDGPVKTGTITWKGSNRDTPPWPRGTNISLLMNTETFTADAAGGQA